VHESYSLVHRAVASTSLWQISNPVGKTEEGGHGVRGNDPWSELHRFLWYKGESAVVVVELCGEVAGRWRQLAAEPNGEEEVNLAIHQ
jgi:hypothetical protein